MVDWNNVASQAGDGAKTLLSGAKNILQGLAGMLGEFFTWIASLGGKSAQAAPFEQAPRPMMRSPGDMRGYGAPAQPMRKPEFVPVPPGLSPVVFKDGAYVPPCQTPNPQEGCGVDAPRPER